MLEKTKELKNLIMKELKKQGWTTKDVSIKTHEYLTSTSFDYIIKTTKVDYKKLEEIAKKFDDFVFDSMTDCHVSGRYMHFIKLDDKLQALVREEQKSNIDNILKDLFESVKSKVNYKDIQISKNIKINVWNDNDKMTLLVRNNDNKFIRELSAHDKCFESIEATFYYYEWFIIETMTRDLINYFE